MNTFVRLTQPWPKCSGCCVLADVLQSFRRTGSQSSGTRATRAEWKRFSRAFAEHCVYADLPRTLGVKLKSAGFNVSHEAVITQYHRNNDPSVFSHYLIERIRGFAPGRQGVSEQEVTDWAGDLQKIGERGGYFFCLNQFVFVVVKPLREQ
jgi:arsenite methyltransferase